MRYFRFLIDECDFQLASYTEEPRAFDNFMAGFVRDDMNVRVTRDRGQVFVDLSTD